MSNGEIVEKQIKHEKSLINILPLVQYDRHDLYAVPLKILIPKILLSVDLYRMHHKTFPLPCPNPPRNVYHPQLKKFLLYLWKQYICAFLRERNQIPVEVEEVKYMCLAICFLFTLSCSANDRPLCNGKIIQ